MSNINSPLHVSMQHLNIAGGMFAMACEENIRSSEDLIIAIISSTQPPSESDLREMVRIDRNRAERTRVTQEFRVRVEMTGGECFDLRKQTFDQDEMIEWLMTHVSGEIEFADSLIAIYDPHTAFYFKICWIDREYR